MSDVKVLGRPAEYDKERSLNAALAVFLRKGYEATSLADLCEAMGMSKSTLSTQCLATNANCASARFVPAATTSWRS